MGAPSFATAFPFSYHCLMSIALFAYNSELGKLQERDVVYQFHCQNQHSEDIDLTAFGSTSSDENLANEVRAVLESEELRKDAEFEVKDVQYIHAEVCHLDCSFLYIH